MKKLQTILFILILAVWSTAASPKQDTSQAAKAATAHTEISVLRIGAVNDFKYGIQDSLSLITDFLVGFGENLRAASLLIESWEANADSTQFTLHLKKESAFMTALNLQQKTVNTILKCLQKTIMQHI